MGSIYTQGNYYAKDVSSPATQLPLASVMHIGGETQDNAEDAIVALSENSDGSDLEDLSDVSVDSPVDGDYLEYDGTANIWVNKPGVKIVTWHDGTDEEIATMLEAHYTGDIDITKYWAVGDERTVSLSAMAATGVDESHVAQTVTMVLMNKGGKTLTTPINEKTTCAFIVGQKNTLNDTTGRINTTHTNNGGWDECARRIWCNSIYKNAFPSTLIKIFKEHQNITDRGNYYSYAKIISNDYFALPSEVEVFGSATNANATAENANNQFNYYETSANRKKQLGDTLIGNTVSYMRWWVRSSYKSDSSSFCYVNNYGSTTYDDSTSLYGIAPFGVI